MNNETKRKLEQYIDHDVVDQTGNKIGKLSCLWSDHQGEPAYLGVQTGWLFGKTHVVPAQSATVNEAGRTIRLPFTADKVKDAPCYDHTVEIDPTTEQEVSSYYNLSSQRPVQASQRAASSSAAGSEKSGLTQDAATVKLHEEELKVGKRQVEAGGVRLRKIIRTETVNQPVELKREEIVVERVPAGAAAQPCQPGTKAFQQEEIYVPLRREEAVIQKESRVREEVRVSKKSQTERQTVSGQVRKEDVEIEEQGKPRVSSGQSEPCDKLDRQQTGKYEPKERSRT